jgi:hypothetical protein
MRRAVPRILEVKQTAEEIVATATENGETAVVHYRLDGKKSDKVYACIKNNDLIIKGTVTRRWAGSEMFGLRCLRSRASSVQASSRREVKAPRKSA